MDIQIYLSIFEALGHETRFKVFDFIYRSGGSGVRPKQIIDQFGFDSGTLDFHLKKLLSVNLISLKSEGHRGTYCVNKQLPLEFALMLDFVYAGNGCIRRENASAGAAKVETLH